MTEPRPAAWASGTDRAGGAGAGARFVGEQLLATVREDIGRADTKAAILLSGALAGPAMLLAGQDRGTLPVSASGITLLAVAALCWLGGVAALVAALLPRTNSSRDGPGMTSFEDLSKTQNLSTLTSRAEAAGRDPTGWLLVRTRDASLILTTKYRWIRRGAGAFALGLIAGLAGLLTR